MKNIKTKTKTKTAYPIDAFSALHPAVEMLFFIYVLAVTMLVMQPVLITISFLSSFIYSVYLNGIKAVKFQLFAILPLMLFTAAINPIFNHAGHTVLFCMKNGNQITLEAVLYGIVAAGMFASIIVWFSCFNKIITSDKFMYLFGKLMPAISLLLSMALRFVPRFAQHIRETANAQKSIGICIESGNGIKRAKHGLRVLSVTITWALESAVTTADSMRSRGYGSGAKRTAFSIYRFDKRDRIMLGFMLVLGAIFILSVAYGGVYVSYFPSVVINPLNTTSILGTIGFGLFCNLPMILNIKENMVWKYLKSKI